MVLDFLQLKPKSSHSKPLEINYEENESVALEIKTKIYKDTISMISNEPWTGTGLGTFEYIFPQYRKNFVNDYHTLHPESNWLDLLSEAGWISTIILLLFFLLIFIISAFVNRHSRSKIIIVSCLCATGALFVNSFYDALYVFH